MRDGDVPTRWTPPRVVDGWAGLPTKSESYILPPVPAKARAALEEVDRLADEISWVQVGHLLRSVDKRIQHLLGLAEAEPCRRLRTVVSRAYSEAYRVQEAYESQMRDFKESRLLAKELRAVVEELRGPLPWEFEEEDFDDASAGPDPFPSFDTPEAETVEISSEPQSDGLLIRALDALERRRQFDPEFIAKWRDETSPSILGYLAELILALERYLAVEPRKGAREKLGRAFFLVRLGEAFSLLTGQEPIFHATHLSRPPSRKDEEPPERGYFPTSQWHRLVSAAISAVDYPEGDQGLDGALRKISSEIPGCREAMRRFAAIAFGVTSELRRAGIVEYKELPSVTILRSLRMPLDNEEVRGRPPEAWEFQSQKPEVGGNF